MLHSSLREGHRVPFPLWTGERQYMIPFKSPIGLGRWSDTVAAMLEGIEVPRVAYLMVDQGIVRAGETHRRSGIHVDGNWLSDIKCHGQPGHRHASNRWGHSPTWSHFEYEPELIVLSTDMSACQAFIGCVDGQSDHEGSCDHLDLTGLDSVRLEAHRAYVMSAETLHQSLPVEHDCLRTVVRLNIPLN